MTAKGIRKALNGYSESNKEAAESLQANAFAIRKRKENMGNA